MKSILQSYVFACHFSLLKLAIGGAERLLDTSKLCKKLSLPSFGFLLLRVEIVAPVTFSVSWTAASNALAIPYTAWLTSLAEREQH